MPRTRNYPRKTKLTALVAADMMTVEGAATATGIPARTIYRWRADPAMSEFVTQTREALADDIQAVAALAWSHLAERIRAGNIDTRDLIMAAGVAIDKSQLLNGGATSRTEARDITGTLSDLDVIGAIREANALATAGRASEAPEDPPEG